MILTLAQTIERVMVVTICTWVNVLHPETNLSDLGPCRPHFYVNVIVWYIEHIDDNTYRSVCRAHFRWNKWNMSILWDYENLLLVREPTVQVFVKWTVPDRKCIIQFPYVFETWSPAGMLWSFCLTLFLNAHVITKSPDVGWSATVPYSLSRCKKQKAEIIVPATKDL